MEKLFFIFLFIPCELFSQADTTKGIQWTTNLTWGDVLKKAKAENKYIFLDCFASWCMPCRAMDKEVYTDVQVGKAINEKFISVKVQMDRTNYDNDTVKKWYPDADRIQKYYAVNAFPTFLFFSPEGKPAHRAVGYKRPKEFIALSKDALDKQKQYYAILANYQPGKFDTSELKGLARTLKNSGGDLAARLATEYLSHISKKELANDDNIKLMIEFRNHESIEEFAVKYLLDVQLGDLSTKKNQELVQSFSSSAKVKKLILINYLKTIDQKDLSKHIPLLTIFKDEPEANSIAQKFIDGLQPNNIFKKEMLFFIADFTKNSKGRGFKIFYNYSDKINKIVGFKGYAQSVIDNVIIGEDYNAYYKAAIEKNVDNIPWKAISDKVTKKFTKEISERLNIKVRASLYGYFAENKNKYWPEYIKYYIENIEKNGYDTTHSQVQFLDVMQLNNFVFDAIFCHSDDTSQFNTGLKWMEGVIRRNPNYSNNIDTYANLLYKSGRKYEAILWEKKAINLASCDKSQEYLLPSLTGNLSKMQKGIPTWIREN